MKARVGIRTSIEVMRLLFPSDPFQSKNPDENYLEETVAARSIGIEYSLFSFEEFQSGTFRPRPRFESGQRVVYRGWMMRAAEYRRLWEDVAACGAGLETTPECYELCHYLPKWLPLLVDFTPETMVFAEFDEVSACLRNLGWDSCFLKDYVKSLSTDGGSLVSDLAEVPAVIAKMKKYRGEIEGGICARRVEAFVSGSEERYFVIHGKPQCRDGTIPSVVNIAAQRIESPFFTVDTIRRADGELRIVELGDGQVSDRKQWSAEQLVGALASSQTDANVNVAS
jgi:hypothetical protein